MIRHDYESLFPALSCIVRKGASLHQQDRSVTMTVVPLRLRGVLHTNERGFLLEAEDGHVWRIEGAEAYAALVDQAVIVEAYKRGVNLLELLWAGPAN